MLPSVSPLSHRIRRAADRPPRTAARAQTGRSALAAALALLAPTVTTAAAPAPDNHCSACVERPAPLLSAGEIPDATPWLLDTSGFPPRWECGQWPTALGWTHIVSDAAIWGAYMAIPLVLAIFLYKRRTPLPLVTWLFIAFIASCGIGHLLEAVIFWQPVYRLAGAWKVVTALASWATVLALIPLAPRVLQWPTLADINSRLRREVLERQRAEEQVSQIIEAAPVGMLLVDRQGTILMVNRELEQTFGYARDELVGQPVELLVPAARRPEHPGHRAAFFAHPSSRQMGGGRELTGLRRDGSEVPLDIGLNPLTTSQGPCVLASVADVTEQRRVADELRELNRRLEDKNAELEQFVYTASHDLKSPLVTIQGFAGLLHRDLDQDRRDRLGEHIGRITDATAQMRSTIDDLLELSRIGRVVQDAAPIDVPALVTGVLESLETPADTTVELEPDLPDATMDRVRLTQVFQNLLANALRHGRPASGAPRITVGGTVADGELRYFVRDNGPGLAAEYHEKVFGLFQRLDTAGEGTGVGLAIVRRIAEVHGGRAWVASDGAGGGATFWFALPAHLAVSAGPPPAAGE